MKLTNSQIWESNLTLGKISKNEISATLAFKLFKIKKVLEDEAIIIQESLNGKEDKKEEIEEVLSIENEIDIEKIKEFELEELKLSVEDVFYLEPIIDFEE